MNFKFNLRDIKKNLHRSDMKYGQLFLFTPQRYSCSILGHNFVNQKLTQNNRFLQAKRGFRNFHWADVFLKTWPSESCWTIQGEHKNYVSYWTPTLKENHPTTVWSRWARLLLTSYIILTETSTAPTMQTRLQKNSYKFRLHESRAESSTTITMRRVSSWMRMATQTKWWT